MSNNNNKGTNGNSSTNSLGGIEKDIRKIKSELKSFRTLVTSTKNVTMNDVYESIELLTKHDEDISKRLEVVESPLDEYYKGEKDELDRMFTKYITSVEDKKNDVEKYLNDKYDEESKRDYGSPDAIINELGGRLKALEKDMADYRKMIESWQEKIRDCEDKQDELYKVSMNIDNDCEKFKKLSERFKNLSLEINNHVE